MNADGSLRPELYPRGLIISTGEDLSRGHSASGRSVAIEIRPGEIDTAILTELQHAGDAGAFAHVTAAFIRYVASQWETVGAAYRKIIAQEISRLRSQPMAHARNPETLAVLAAAAHTWLIVLHKLEAITGAEQDAAALRCTRGIDAVGAEQADMLQGVD